MCCNNRGTITLYKLISPRRTVIPLVAAVFLYLGAKESFQAARGGQNQQRGDYHTRDRQGETISLRLMTR
jgi:hypothetical protein